MDHRASLLLIFCWALGTLLSALHACLENTTGAELEEHTESKGSGRIVGARLSATRAIIPNLQPHAHAVALARILCNLGLAVASVFVVSSLRERPAPDLVDAVIGVAVSAITLWIFSVSIAESIGRHLPERFLYFFSPVVRAIYLLQRPLVPLAGIIDTMVRKLSGAERIDKTAEVADEILSVAEEGEREGLIDEGERQMIESVVNFKHRTVEQIMTPRSEVEAMEFTSSLSAINAFVRKVRHSRIPVFRSGGSLDEVIGFFYVKDLLRWLAGDVPRASAGAGFDLKNILRTALHVPNSKTIRELADEFVAKKVHAAVVVNEFGAVIGLVTMEDIIEEVFGDIQDEFERHEDAAPRIEVKPVEGGERAGLADIDARAYVTDANAAIDAIGAAIPESDDYDTVGGFVLWTLGHMPEVNESFSHGRMNITILEAMPTRVLKVRIQIRGDDDMSRPVLLAPPASSTNAPSRTHNGAGRTS